MNLKEYYKKYLSEAIEARRVELAPHVDEHFGRIVDHNASTGIDPNENVKEKIQQAKAIVGEAKRNGHNGLHVNQKGQIVKIKTIHDMLGRGATEVPTVIRAYTTPFTSYKGTHEWSFEDSNSHEYTGNPYTGIRHELPTPSNESGRVKSVSAVPNYPTIKSKGNKIIKRMGGMFS